MQRTTQEAIYSGPGCQKDPMRPLAEDTISTARPTSPACWWSSLSSGFTATSTVDSTGMFSKAETGNKGLKATVGEFAGVGFLDLWTSSSSGIALGMTIIPVLPDFDDRICTGADPTIPVNWDWSWICTGPFSVPSSLP